MHMKNKISIVVGTQNNVKVKSVNVAARLVFRKKCLIIKTDARSGVSEQPIGFKEIVEGARNRIISSRKVYPTATYYVGIESGIIYHDIFDTYFDTSISLVEDQMGREGRGWSTTFEILPEIMELVQTGKTLGQASDIFYGTNDIGNKEGYSGLITNRLVPRHALHLQPTIFAFKTIQTLR